MVVSSAGIKLDFQSTFFRHIQKLLEIEGSQNGGSAVPEVLNTIDLLFLSLNEKGICEFLPDNSLKVVEAPIRRRVKRA